MKPRLPVALRASGLRYMAASALSFSLMSALVKAAGARLPTMEVVLFRSVLVLALAALTLARQDVGFGGRERRLLLLRGVLGFIALSAFYYSVIHLPLADATVIQYTNPVFTALLAAALLGEGLRAREMGLALTSLCGVVIVARPTFLFGRGVDALDPTAVTVAVCGAAFSAMAYVTVRRLKGEDAVVVVLWFSLVSALGALPSTLLAWVTPRGHEWLVLLGIGVTTHLGQVFITRGLQRERAGRAMTVGYLQIVFAAVWGVLFFAEVPDRWTFLGASVVLASTLLLGRDDGAGSPAGSRRGGTSR